MAKPAFNSARRGAHWMLAIVLAIAIWWGLQLVQLVAIVALGEASAALGATALAWQPVLEFAALLLMAVAAWPIGCIAVRVLPRARSAEIALFVAALLIIVAAINATGGVSSRSLGPVLLGNAVATLSAWAGCRWSRRRHARRAVAVRSGSSPTVRSPSPHLYAVETLQHKRQDSP